MPGFTAINTRAPAVPAPKLDAEPTASGMVPGRRRDTERRQSTRKQAAPSKDDNQTAPRESTRKRISGKGKKRTSHQGDESEPKRRKSGSIKSSMPNTKPAVNTAATADSATIETPCSSSTDAGLVFLTARTRLDGFRYKSGQTQPQHTESASASYAPETSMDMVGQSMPQTTMQAVRSSSRGGSLLYSSSASSPPKVHGLENTRPSIGSTPTLAFSSGDMTTMDPHPQQTPTVIGSTPTLAFSSGNMTTLDPHPQQTPTLIVSDAAVYDEEQTLLQHGRVLQAETNEYEDLMSEIDDEMIELVKRVEKHAPADKSPPSRARKLNIRDTHEHDDYGGALLSVEERKILDAIKLPQHSPRPIVRNKFPLPIMDRTSLFGVSNASALRTCFRIGEALNAGCQAVRNNRTLVLELYARVTSSWREPKPSRKQHFIINDLYHDKPPYINGTFELWDQNTLWEQDSRPFLSAGAAGIMCRMIARMKRDGTKWRLEILSVWQADWEDVEHVASIYAKPMADDTA